ncbi:MAG: hypothetical protein QOI98_950 [Solirubrobacteraceae bacterium]|nr:hypothetical protein [Solirubrobacteraceae bacterium]
MIPARGAEALDSIPAVMRRALAIAVAGGCLAGASPAAARTYRITVDHGFPVRLGPLKVQQHPFVRDAESAFGRASSTRPVRGACKVRWSRLKLNATFTSFGAITDFCRDARFQTAVLRSSVWQTWKGLRVGMASSRVLELHRNAKFDRGKWVLATQSVFGPEPAPTVSALVRRGRVYALSLFVGAAGD